MGGIYGSRWEGELGGESQYGTYHNCCYVKSKLFCWRQNMTTLVNSHCMMDFLDAESLKKQYADETFSQKGSQPSLEFVSLGGKKVE